MMSIYIYIYIRTSFSLYVGFSWWYFTEYMNNNCTDLIKKHSDIKHGKKMKSKNTNNLEDVVLTVNIFILLLSKIQSISSTVDMNSNKAIVTSMYRLSKKKKKKGNKVLKNKLSIRYILIYLSQSVLIYYSYMCIHHMLYIYIYNSYLPNIAWSYQSLLWNTSASILYQSYVSHLSWLRQ